MKVKKIILNFLDIFAGVFKLLGVNYNQLRSIIWVKLTTDIRRTDIYLNRKDREKRFNTLQKTLLLNLVYGIFISYLIIYFKSIFLSMTLIHFIIMSIAAISFVLNYAQELFSITENVLLLPHPINSRTILASRITHITIYIYLNTMALAFASIVIGAFKFGLLFCICFLITLSLSVLLVIFFINLFYIGIVKFTRGEKILDVLSYVPFFLILISTMLFILRDKLNLKNLIIPLLSFWKYLLPPAWMGGILEAVVNNNFLKSHLIFILLAVIIPVISILMVILLLASDFDRKMSQMSISTYKKRKKRAGNSHQNIVSFCSRIITHTSTEKSVFEMIWKILFRDKKFKIAAFFFYAPSIYIWIFPISENKSYQDVINTLSKSYIGLLFFMGFFIFMLLTNFVFSDNYKAAWIYYELPIDKPGEVLAGALKSIIVKIISPVLISYSVFVLYIWGIKTLDDIIFTFLNFMLLCINLAFIYARNFPFSEKPIVIDLSGKVMHTFLSLLLFTLIGVAYYYLFARLNFGVLLTIPILTLIVVSLFKKYRNISWELLKK